MNSQRRAVALLSGGLDSMLAARIILEQGIEVIGLNFYTGFCHSGHTSSIRKTDRNQPKRNDALWVAEQLGIKLHILDVVEPYKDVLLHPRYGYGKNMNPCLDCKIFMVKKAYSWMENEGCDFIITGEVIGQRPKSQLKVNFPMVADESGAGERLLRPLCAKNLPPTLPEREGWVDRNRLYGITGRGRKEQMALAEYYGFKEYAQPAGGCCVLTDMTYSKRLSDFWQNSQTRQYELDDIIILKVGRHLRIRPGLKVIISRDEGESQFLKGYQHKFISLETISCHGPFTILEGEPTQEELQLIARIVARFSKDRDAKNVNIQINNPNKSSIYLEVKPFLPSEIQNNWYLK